MYYRCTQFLEFFDLILLLPPKRCLIISHLQKIFQICSNFDHKLVRMIICNFGAGCLEFSRSRSCLTSVHKNLEKKYNMFYYDWVIFQHLFRGSSKIKSRNGKNKKYLQGTPVFKSFTRKNVQGGYELDSYDHSAKQCYSHSTNQSPYTLYVEQMMSKNNHHCIR